MWNSSQQLLLRSSDRISIPDNQQELDTLTQGLVYFLLLLNSLTVIHLIYCWNIRFQASSSHSKIASLKKKVCGSIWVWLFLSTQTFDTYNSILHRMFCYYSCIKHNHFWRFLEVVNVGCYRESRDPSIKFYLLQAIRTARETKIYRTIASMMVVFIAFIACWTPLSTAGFEDFNGRLPANLCVAAMSFGMLNSCLNTFVYALLNQKCRVSYTLLLFRKWRQLRSDHLNLDLPYTMERQNGTTN